MASVLSDKHFHNEKAAYAFVEARVWPKGAVCPHCGGFDRISKMNGKSTRIGAYKCYQCRKPFTVKIGTVFEDSHIKLHLWLQAIFLMASSKKGISSNQLHRTLGITLKSAWFMSHRIREAMRTVHVEPMGGSGEIVEADETFYGMQEGQPKRRQGSGSRSKNTILSLVQRDGGVRSFHVDDTTIGKLIPIIRANVNEETAMMTDEWRSYNSLGSLFASHETVKHSAYEYVRGNVTTNTVEGFFSIFKRGMKGVYQHCKERHLHRYLSEFDFRYSNRAKLGVNDEMRAERLLKGIVGKRLTYQPASH